MVRIGIIGIGFMGVTHYKAMAKVKGARVTAICTRNPKKLQGDWRQVQGNFGGSGGVQDLSKIARYSDIGELLADEKVDLVDICLPTNMHAQVALDALEAGKHVLLEKPIALSLKAADRIVAEAKKRRLRCMVGHVLRYFPEFRIIKSLIDGREQGRVLAAHFKRIIAEPAWWDPRDLERTGGPAIDLHIHDSDFVQFLFGMPESVASNGFVRRGGIVEHLHTHYHFGGRSMAISAEGGWLAQQGCPFEHGYDVYFEHATLKYNSSWGHPPVLLTRDGKCRKPRLPRQDGFVAELQDAVDAVRAGRDSSVLSGASARNSLLLCLKEVQSVKTGKRVRVP